MSAAESASARMTLRHRLWEDSRLVRALAASLLLHLLAYGAFKAGQRMRVWDKLQVPAWVQKATDAIVPPLWSRPAPPEPREAPVMFVEVNPAHAAATPPADTKYYAAVSTVAAQPEPAAEEKPLPRLDGTQDRMLRTEDTPLSRGQPLQPAPLQPVTKPGEEAGPPPRPAETPGALTMAKPADVERKTDGPSERPRPRTLAEARARQAATEPRLTTAGEKARAEGGARRRAIATTLNAVGSPMGAYDAQIVAAIQERWFALLDQRNYASDRAGKVVLEFKLHYDGRVTDLRVVQHTVDELLSLLCQKAVLDPAPYARWPAEMRRLVNGDSREVRFTFFYN